MAGFPFLTTLIVNLPARFCHAGKERWYGGGGLYVYTELYGKHAVHVSSPKSHGCQFGICLQKGVLTPHEAETPKLFHQATFQYILI